MFIILSVYLCQSNPTQTEPRPIPNIEIGTGTGLKFEPWAANGPLTSSKMWVQYGETVCILDKRTPIYLESNIGSSDYAPAQSLRFWVDPDYTAQWDVIINYVRVRKDK